MKLQKIVFLDRDGVLCEYKEYLCRSEDFVLIPSSLKALRLLNQSGYLCFVVTNQPMVARGMITEELLLDMHDRLHQAALMAGGKIEKILFCPHTPGPRKPGYIPELVVDCDCRKPKVGMIQKVQQILNESSQGIDLTQSWMIGDSWRDILLGKNANVRTGGVLGVPDLKHPELISEPDVTGKNLLEIVEKILAG